MPCYERCWEAHDPAKCFQYLQESPTSSDVSSYLYKLYQCRGEDPLNFKVSHYGLFTLVLALHASLLRSIQEEPEPHPSPYLSQRLFQLVDPLAVLQRQITGESVAILADTLIELYGSASMKECNRAFNACRRVWNQVCVSNLEGQPCTSFFTDPLPFWYLAKMYQALYLCDDFIEGNTVFELPMKRGRHDPWEIEIHHTIIAWLNYFRDKVSLEDTEGMQPDANTSTDSTLGSVLGISVLMKP